MSPIEWKDLRAAALDAARRGYAPYSGLRVGAAALTDDGRTITGCNVENASYGLSLCAECGLVSALHAGGGGRLVALACVGLPAGGPGRLLTPCGRCRQLLHEHGGPGLLVAAEAGPVRLADLLPAAFGPADLAGASTRPGAGG